METEKTKETNIASPPNLGVLVRCLFLSLGSSYKCFSLAMVSIDGIENITIKNEVKQA
jgi:hypothetical protein